jgi:hypothetical protein
MTPTEGETMTDTENRDADKAFARKLFTPTTPDTEPPAPPDPKPGNVVPREGTLGEQYPADWEARTTVNNLFSN